jgi:hypothetical protein
MYTHMHTHLKHTHTLNTHTLLALNTHTLKRHTETRNNLDVGIGRGKQDFFKVVVIHMQPKLVARAR